MGVINQLSTDVSNKIAAGEVVENPASVIKELVENSIDAGATVISVEIENGGRTFMRVTDNGCGMAPEDAKACFLRHATSKIKTANDLNAITTLGFRGEAMSSIGAVSKLELFTKRPQDEMGTVIEFEGGAEKSCVEAGTADGTSIVIKDLFFNTPARLKFLKKDASEGAKVSAVMSHFILSHPEVSFRLTKDGKEQFFTPGDNDLKNAVYAVYGRDYAKATIDVDYEMDGIHIFGVVGKSETGHTKYIYQSFFVNGRYIEEFRLRGVIDEAYKNQIMIGKHPLAVLNIELNPEDVDINVHPKKMEAKFADTEAVMRAVYHAVKNAIYQEPNIPKIEREPEITPEPIIPEPKSTWEPAKLPTQRGGMSAYEKAPHEVYLPKQTYTPPKKVDWDRARAKAEKPQQVLFVASEQQTIKGVENIPTQIRIIGQLFDTYILAESGEELLMVDQHAAHERLKYEELKEELKSRKITPQGLLLPVLVDLLPTELENIESARGKLEELGFEFECKKGQYRITATPAPMDEDEMVSDFRELLAAISDGRMNVITSAKERLTYTIACKAAIKANYKCTEVEMEDLVRRVLAMKNINTCPHGRPIIIKMTKKEIEKEFGRTL